ncbi:protein HIRA/HIR1, partial [Tremellales sp. Uapishka_1]
MKVTKPNWVEHTGEKKNKCPIYSISVHPDGTRLATGGLGKLTSMSLLIVQLIDCNGNTDHKVKIWSTLPILDKEAEEDEANHKLLCTMSTHTGKSAATRSGNLLTDRMALGPVLSVRWAHHGRYLASGSDDHVVMVWDIDPNGGGRLWGSDEVNVENWKALRRLVGHVADVVDIAWSRDDSMLASVGLDSTVWIWDGFTFDRLRKLDMHQGFVKGVCWDPVGNYLATQSDDKTVKIWDTGDWSLVQSVGRPFERSPQSTFFRRLSWSPDGAFIAASNAMNGPVFVAAVIEREGWSSEISFVGHENTIQVAAFNPRLFFRAQDEPSRATASCMVALGADDLSISIWRNTLHKPIVVLRELFGRQLLDLCWSNDGYHLYGASADGTICAITFEPSEFPELAEADKTDVILNEYEYKPKRQPREMSFAPPAQPYSNGFGSQAIRAVASAPTAEVVNVLQARKSKPGQPKKRVALNGGGNSAMDAFAAAADQPLAATSSAQSSTAQMLRAAPLFESPRGGGKRKTSVEDESARAGPSTRRRVAEEVTEIRAVKVSVGEKSLPVPKVQSVVRVKMEGDNGEYIEAKNSKEGEKSAIYCSRGWTCDTPNAVLDLVITPSFAAASLEDGTVIVFSPHGRQLSTSKLDSPCSYLHGCKTMLLTISSKGTARVLDTRRHKAVLLPTPICHLLDSPNSITSAVVRPNGAPIITISSTTVWTFDSFSGDWTEIASSRYRRPTVPFGDGAIAKIEGSLKPSPNAPEPEDWMSVMEMKMRAAILLDAPDDYKLAYNGLVQSMKKSASLGKAEEMIKEFIDRADGRQNSGDKDWDPLVLGFKKKDLIKEMLDELVKLVGFLMMAVVTDDEASSPFRLRLIGVASKTATALSGRLLAQFSHTLKEEVRAKEEDERETLKVLVDYHLARVDVCMAEPNEVLALGQMKEAIALDSPGILLPADYRPIAAKCYHVGNMLKTPDGKGMARQDKVKEAIKWYREGLQVVTKMEANGGKEYSWMRTTKGQDGSIQHEIMALRLHVLKEGQHPAEEISKILSDRLSNTAWSEEDVARVIAEILSLTKYPDLASSTLQDFLCQAMSTPQRYAHVNRILPTLIWETVFAKKNDEDSKKFQAAKYALDSIARAEGYRLEDGEVAAIVQNLLYKQGEISRKKVKYEAAAQWFSLAAHPALHVRNEHFSNCRRQAALSFIDAGFFEQAQQQLELCSSKEAVTHYLIFCTAVKQLSQGHALKAIDDLLLCPDWTKTQLLLMARLAHENGLQDVLLASFEAILSVWKTTPATAEIIDPTTLIRALVQMIVEHLDSARNPAILGRKLVEYLTAVREAVLEAVITSYPLATRYDVERFAHFVQEFSQILFKQTYEGDMERVIKIAARVVKVMESPLGEAYPVDQAHWLLDKIWNHGLEEEQLGRSLSAARWLNLGMGLVAHMEVPEGQPRQMQKTFECAI